MIRDQAYHFVESGTKMRHGFGIKDQKFGSLVCSTLRVHEALQESSFSIWQLSREIIVLFWPKPSITL